MRAGIFAALVACNEPEPPPGTDDVTPGCPDPSVELASGYEPIAALADGATLPMVHGPQGGWHLDTGAFVVFPVAKVSIVPSIHLGDRTLAGDQIPFYAILVDYDAETCAGRFSEVRAYIDDEIPSLPPETDVLREYICDLGGASVTVDLAVSDLEGEVLVTTSVDGVLELDPYDANLCGG